MKLRLQPSALRGARCLRPDDLGIIEARILPNGIGSVRAGFFDSPFRLARAIQAAGRARSNASFYVTLNPVRPELLSRADNRFVRAASGQQAKDSDILARRWFPIDVDPVRPRGVASTDRELQTAIERRDAVVAFLRTQGWPECLTAVSGNGAHALFRVELPNTPDVTRAFKAALQALHARFSDGQATVDRAVFNASRIWKLYGTVARKGADTANRPHRTARIQRCPSDMGAVSLQQLEGLANETRRRKVAGDPSIPQWLDEFKEHGLYLRDLGDGRHAVTCPWVGEHSGSSNDTETVVFEPGRSNAGKGGFKCQHDHCIDRTLVDVRQLWPKRIGRLVRLADVEAETVTFFWSPYLPFGKLTLVEGDPGIGKSWFCLALAKATSLGIGLPGMPRCQPANALLLTAEDGVGDTIRPRMERMGGNLRRIRILEGHLEFDAAGLAQLDADIQQVRAKLVIVDPLVAYLGAGLDMNRANETRAVMARLSVIASRHGCAMVLLRHLTKSGKDKAIYRGLGSIDLTAACRSVLLIGRTPEDPEASVVIHIKSNLAKTGPSQGYEIHDGAFRWTGESSLTAANVFAPDTHAPTRTEKAVDFLLGSLRGQEVAAAKVKALAAAQGITLKPLRNARARLRVKIRTVRTASGQTLQSLWSLPSHPEGSGDGKASGQVARAKTRKARK